ncbi:PAS domain S-box [Beggiatoa alba B18LD]|uniref:histidine kinase n=1 Tax=Beggiatoa alba B18LD TaxID=395493 RepID=I3CFD7_9GAMM|nr:PAS domain S-box protein [Beggiatoa alba]EIJ42330.1 PAS domain S-box [Beggiatoa alba B18LD]
MNSVANLEINLLHATTDGVFLLKEDGTILFANKVGAQWFRKTPDELIGRCIWGFLPTNIAQYRQTIVQTVIQTQQPKTLIDKSISYWYEGRYFPIFDEQQNIIYIAVYYREIADFNLNNTDEHYSPLANTKQFIGSTEWSTKKYFNHLLQHNPAVIYTFSVIIDPFNKFTFIPRFVSQNVENLTGYPALTFLSEPHFWFKNIHPDDQCLIENKLRKTRDNTVFEYEYRFLHANGIYIWIQDAMYLNYENNKKTLELSGSWINITPRKLAEQAFNESEIRFKGIFNNSAVGIAVLDSHSGRFLSTNQKLAGLLGYNSDELSFFTLFNLTHPNDRQQIQVALAELTHQEIPQTYIEQRYIKQNSTIFWGATWLSTLASNTGNIFAVVCIIIDLTDRKKTELALKDSEEMFRQVSATSQDAIIIINSDNLVIYWNQAAERIFQYTADEVLGKPLHTKILSTDNWDTYQENMSRFKQKGIGEYLNKVSEIIAIRKTGETFPVEIFITSLWLKGQWHAVGTVRDITRRKQAEEDLKKALNELQRSIAEAERARLAAESANLAKSTFLANMSHELRTPLNGILGYAQILLRDTKLAEQQHEKLSVILRSGQHLLNLINDILDLSKIESGKFELNPYEFNLQNFLHDIVGLFKLKAEEKGLMFTYKKIPPPSTWHFETLQGIPNIIVADEKRLRQILLNLLSNAVKYTEQGAVTFSIIYHNEIMRFEVEDTGIGIPETMLHKIFIPFQQINQHTLLHNVEGTGLGLSITKKLLEMMGSQLYVQSIVGKGSIFWFELKLKVIQYIDSHQPAQNERPLIEFKDKKHKFLIVDDIEINRYVLIDLLSDLNSDVEEAENGLVAVEKTKYLQPDIIIMDLKMPVMDGLTATQLIRQQSTNQHHPFIIACSASAFKEDEEQSLASGCDAFITKPIDSQQLFNLLEKHGIIECIYRTPDNDVQNHPFANSATLKQLEFVQLAQFYKLAKAGDVTALIQVASTLKQQRSEYTICLEEIIQLAKNFKLKRLKALLKDALGDKA